MYRHYARWIGDASKENERRLIAAFPTCESAAPKFEADLGKKATPQKKKYHSSKNRAYCECAKRP
jgi:hypothetical protein